MTVSADKVAKDLIDCKTKVELDMRLIREEMAEIKDGVDSILEIYNAGDGFVKVANWIEKIAMWLLKISAIFGALYIIGKNVLKGLIP